MKRPAQTVSMDSYTAIALGDPDGRWELECGHLTQKPAMTTEHDDTITLLHHQLATQLAPTDFRVSANLARLRWLGESRVSIPDLVIVPAALVLRNRATPGMLNVYVEPMPLVVEVWSPSTGYYDINTKLAAYQARGDGEIWRIHPYDHTLTAWRRMPDGSYTEHLYHSGTVTLHSLPQVRVDLDALFS